MPQPTLHGQPCHLVQGLGHQPRTRDDDSAPPPLADVDPPKTVNTTPLTPPSQPSPPLLPQRARAALTSGHAAGLGPDNSAFGDWASGVGSLAPRRPRPRQQGLTPPTSRSRRNRLVAAARRPRHRLPRLQEPGLATDSLAFCSAPGLSLLPCHCRLGFPVLSRSRRGWRRDGAPRGATELDP